MLIQANQFPIDVGRKIAQYRIDRWVDAKGRSYQDEEWVGIGYRQRSPGVIEKISKLLKLIALLMPFHPCPVIEPLERKVDIFVSLEFNYP